MLKKNANENKISESMNKMKKRALNYSEDAHNQNRFKDDPALQLSLKRIQKKGQEHARAQRSHSSMQNSKNSTIDVRVDLQSIKK